MCSAKCGMTTVMIANRQALQVFQTIVDFYAILMMDMMFLRNRSVCLFPNKDMFMAVLPFSNSDEDISIFSINVPSAFPLPVLFSQKPSAVAVDKAYWVARIMPSTPVSVGCYACFLTASALTEAFWRSPIFRGFNDRRFLHSTKSSRFCPMPFDKALSTLDRRRSKVTATSTRTGDIHANMITRTYKVC